MRYGLFGRTGLRVSELFLGAMRFVSVDQARPIVDRYAEAGGNVIDTADAYGASEDIVGEALPGRRDRFVLASKYSLPRDPSDVNATGNHRKNLTLALELRLPAEAVQQLESATGFTLGFPGDFLTPELLDQDRVDGR